MDELTDFERRLAAGLDGLVGPRRAVQADAITRAAVQGGRPSALRSLLGGRSMSRPRLAYAGFAALLLMVGGIAGFAVASLTNQPAIVASPGPSTPLPTSSTGSWPAEPAVRRLLDGTVD